MHKRILLGIGILAGVVSSMYAVIYASATDATSWINSSLFLQKEADTQSLPNAWNGNIDCSPESPTLCSVPTSYGSATPNNTVRLNTSGDFYPVYSNIENRQRYLPISNSSTAITYTTEPSYGFYLYFNYNFSSVVTKTFVSGVGTAYKIHASPDGKLADKSNKRLAADYTSISYSSTGQWLVVSSPNVAMLRVNLQTFEVIPFGQAFNYTIGVDPAPKTAITNDGRYAVVASKNFDRFMLYDLSTCAVVPGTINSHVSCQSRDLGVFMKQQVTGYQFISQARFLNNDTLAVYAAYKDGTTLKTARFIISNTSILSQIDYLALGDSYISGEGAFDYQSGTDTMDNHCHLSLRSYPYLIGYDLNYNSYHSVACSGAVTLDITDTAIPNGVKYSQADGKDTVNFNDEIYSSFLPGYRAQINFVTKYRPRAMTISIVGNDIGFSDIVIKCAAFWNIDNCYESYEDRLELVRLINSRFPKLLETYTLLKNQSSPDARIYIIGYPQIAKPGGSCGLNVRLSNEEAKFSEQIINYLNTVINAAADRAGVYYVNTEDALNDHRLCEAEPGSVAVNGLTAGTDAPALTRGPIGNESFHPNDLGHQLLENKILSATNNLTASMPAPNLNAAPPPENGLAILSAPKQNRSVNAIQYNDNMVKDVIFKGTSSGLDVQGQDFSLTPGETYKVELRSDPVNLGNFAASASGNIKAQIQVPSTVPIGFHTLHVYGTNLAGENIYIYKVVYVADSEDDYDGDGIQNSIDDCFFMTPAGQDYDQDGIDDACDAVINQPPPPPPSPPTAPTIQADPIENNDPEIANPPVLTPIDEIPIDNSQPGTVDLEDENSTLAYVIRDEANLSDNAVLGATIDDSAQPPVASSPQNTANVDIERTSNNELRTDNNPEINKSANSSSTKISLGSIDITQHWPVMLLLVSAGVLLLKLTTNLQTRDY